MELDSTGSILPTPDQAANTSCLILTSCLRQVALEAKKQPIFDKRTKMMAVIVGLETGAKAALAVRADDNAAMVRVFTEAATEAGMAFSDAFGPADGAPNHNEDSYKRAVNSAGAIAVKYLPRAAEVAGVVADEETILKTLSGLSFTHILDLAMFELIGHMPPGRLDSSVGGFVQRMNPEDIKTALRSLVDSSDYFYLEIDNIPFDGQNYRNVSDEVRTVLDLALRLANATWKSGQVHRAVWEGSDDRINPEKRGGVFNPYDWVKIQMYEELMTQHSEHEAVIRVAFEMYKDLLEVRKAALSGPKAS